MYYNNFNLKNKLLTAKRKKILVYWYQYHRELNFWPTLREADLYLDIPFSTIQYHINVLCNAGWITKLNRQIALTKEGETALYESELISLGKASKKINFVKNIIRKND